MTLIDDAFAAVEREERKKVVEYERQLPMRRERFREALWNALAIPIKVDTLPEGEPELVIENLRFVLMLSRNAGHTEEAHLGLQTVCGLCETPLTFSISNILALGLLLTAPPPLCSVCTVEMERKQQETYAEMEGEQKPPTAEDTLVEALRSFIHANC